MKLTFDDVLIVPKYSEIESRKDVNLAVNLDPNYGLPLELPIISSNMDTVTGPKMARAMRANGGIGCLHRFYETDQYINTIKNCPNFTIVSFGVGYKEQLRVVKIVEECTQFLFCLDVAHGAQKQVVDQVKWFKNKYPHCWLMVGNFAPHSLEAFLKELGPKELPDAVKIGIGPGSACTTRIKTGVGYPQLSAIMESKALLRFWAKDSRLVADGGMRTSGDVAKAIAAGADSVMLGGMLAGTDETPGDVIGSKYVDVHLDQVKHFPMYKKYRGSASKESYEAQKKDWACAEGESFKVPYKGPVKLILDDIAGGLRSALTYVGARDITEFREKAEFITVSGNTLRENGAHGAK